MSIGFSQFAQMGLSLAIVVGLIFALSFLLRRVQHQAGSSTESLRLLGGLTLGGKEKVYLVEVAGQRVLVGVAPGCDNFLPQPPVDAAATDTTAEETGVAPAAVEAPRGLRMMMEHLQ